MCGMGGKANNPGKENMKENMKAQGRERKESEASDCEEGSMCQVCMNRIQVWSVGECNHVICHVCSTR